MTTITVSKCITDVEWPYDITEIKIVSEFPDMEYAIKKLKEGEKKLKENKNVSNKSVEKLVDDGFLEEIGEDKEGKKLYRAVESTETDNKTFLTE